MMTTPWDDFIVRILVGRYHAVHLMAGHDHHFGHRNQGTPELLAQKCPAGLGCDIIPKVEVSVTVAHPPTSAGWWSWGRSAGPTASWATPPDRHSPPRPGHRLSQLFLTANLVILPHVLVPSHRYTPPGPHWRTAPATLAAVATWAPPHGSKRPDITVEACLLDFQGDLYGKQLRLEFYEHLRQEVLRLWTPRPRQIQSDADATRTYFADGVPTFPAP